MNATTPIVLWVVMIYDISIMAHHNIHEHDAITYIHGLSSSRWNAMLKLFFTATTLLVIQMN